jgi:hypothetical protein
MPSPDSATPPEAAAWLARAQALAEQATPKALAEAVRAYECAITLLRARPTTDLALRRDLALAHLNHGNTLQQLATPAAFTAAILAYDAAISLLASPDFAAQPAAQNTCGAVWINRGHALHRQGTPDSLAAAGDSHRSAIAVLQTLPLDPSGATTPEAVFNHRLNLAGAWMNLANTLLDSPALAHRYPAAREAATHALDLISRDDLPSQHPAAAEISLVARRARCDALGHLIFAVADPALARDLTEEAGDLIDDGLALVRQWEQRGLPHFRPLAARLYHFGAQLYRVRQPHFLAEFLLENLDPEKTPGVPPADPNLHAIADEALAAALQTLRAPRIIRADDPATLRQIETLRSLQAAELRLAEIRCAHVPPATTA